MTEIEQQHFVEAYSNNVAHAPSDYVAQFVARIESGEDMPYCEYYTSIVDALGVWQAARNFYTTNKEKHNG